MTRLFRIGDQGPEEASSSQIGFERELEDWIAADVGLLGLDLIIIGRSVPTDHGTQIDLLAIDSAGSLVVIELKRRKTPRKVVAQALDYASWVRTLSTPQVHEMAEEYLGGPLSVEFRQRFGTNLPERLNGSHSMLIVADEFDPASRRIVEYLAEEYGVAINTFFFNVFCVDGTKWMTADSLLDQTEVDERSQQKVKPPWSGYWYVNNGECHRRSWKDMVKYGFIGGGGGEIFSKPFRNLKCGDGIFAYHNGCGYVGYGIVTEERVLAKDFQTASGPLFDQELTPGKDDMRRLQPDDPKLGEYVVAVDWKKVYDPPEAKKFKGIFAVPNTVAKLRHPETVEFLLKQFEVEVADDAPQFEKPSEQSEQ